MRASLPCYSEPRSRLIPSDPLERRRGSQRRVAFLSTIALLVVIASVDYATGVELRVYPLYVLPVALAAWRLSLAVAIAFGVIASLMWLGSNALAGLTFTHPGIWVANTLSHLITFETIVWLVNRLREKTLAESHLARTDALTGLPNLRAFAENARSEIARQKRNGGSLAVAYIDLDGFKSVNDRFGHSVGDELLAVVGAKLHAALRTTDTVARIGGDEFAVLLSGLDRGALRQLLERVRSKLLSEMESKSWPVTFSIGAIVLAEPPPSAESLIESADRLMYEVKHSGKNALKVQVGLEGSSAALPAPASTNERASGH